MSVDFTDRPEQVGIDNDFSRATDDLKRGMEELNDSQDHYLYADAYAKGRSPELFFVSDAARSAVAAFIDYFRLNFAKLPISIIADRCAIQGFDGPSSIQELLKFNQFYKWSGNLIWNTLKFGDAYVILSDPQDSSDRIPILNPQEPYNVRVIYDDEIGREPLFAIHRWKVDGERNTWRANVWYPEYVDRFIRGDDGRWEYYETDGVFASEAHDYDGIPVIHLSNDFPYGEPTHYDAYGPQDGIIKLVMTFLTSIEFMGWPQRYVLQKLDNRGQFSLPRSAPADGTPDPLGLGGADRRLRGGPGTLLELYGESVGTFPSADVDKLISGVGLFVRAMAQVTRSPMHYFDPSREVPSGEAYAAADVPVKARTNRMRRSMTFGFDEMVRMSLARMGVKAQPAAIWAPDAPITDKSWWETAQIRHSMGVSLPQIYTEAGYTEAQQATFKTTTTEE